MKISKCQISFFLIFVGCFIKTNANQYFMTEKLVIIDKDNYLENIPMEKEEYVFEPKDIETSKKFTYEDHPFKVILLKSPCNVSSFGFFYFPPKFKRELSSKINHSGINLL